MDHVTCVLTLRDCYLCPSTELPRGKRSSNDRQRKNSWLVVNDWRTPWGASKVVRWFSWLFDHVTQRSAGVVSHKNVAQLRLIFAVDRTDKLLSRPAKYLPGSGFSIGWFCHQPIRSFSECHVTWRKIWNFFRIYCGRSRSRDLLDFEKI
jgi:hypothetical protein